MSTMLQRVAMGPPRGRGRFRVGRDERWAAKSWVPVKMEAWWWRLNRASCNGKGAFFLPRVKNFADFA